MLPCPPMPPTPKPAQDSLLTSRDNRWLKQFRIALRTAAAFGAPGAVTSATGQSGTASPFSPKALRASAGAALHLPLVAGAALGILLTQFKLNGISTIATCVHENSSADAPSAPWELDWCQPIALLA